MRLRRIAFLTCGALLGLVLLGVLDRMTGIVDSEQAAICRRILPALHPGEPLTLHRIARGAQSRDVVISYDVGEAGQPVPAQVTCRFASAGLDAGRRDLIGLRTREGEVPPATLYFLKRFWLGSGDAVTSDPGMPPPWRALQVPMPVAYGVQQLLSAMPSAAVYALLAAAYALVYGLIGRVMLGFGEIAALGSIAGVIAVAASLDTRLVTPVGAVVFAAMVAVAASALHGQAGWLTILRPIGKANGQHVLIATVGLSLAVSEYLRLAQGNETRWLPPVASLPLPVLASGSFVASISPAVVATTLLGLGTCAGVIIHLSRSRFGRDWRAVADDSGMARLIGIDSDRVLARSIVIACGLSAVAGMIITVIFGGLGYAGGLAIGLKGLVAAVLGGIGSVRGAVLGGLAIAAIEAAWSSLLPIEQRDLAIYALLAVVLVIRPGGFFGEPQLSPRQV